MITFPRTPFGATTFLPTRNLEGLSPRGRGNRPGGRLPNGGQRSIPAWAGKPEFQPRPPLEAAVNAWARNHELVGAPDGRGVYPRVGGETANEQVRLEPGAGLSPRGRGNLDSFAVCKGIERSIPAWAGKPPREHRRINLYGVYPRVGGETGPASSSPRSSVGLSPRGRGNL